MSNVAINKLIEISSPPTSEDTPSKIDLPCGLDVLFKKNGFFAFEKALEIFPLGTSALSYPITQWNDTETWRSAYKNLAPAGMAFAQDIFGIQFLVSDAIYCFDPETADTNFVAKTIEDWAKKILLYYDIMTGQPIAHAWQCMHGPLLNRRRLIPITPFVLGGRYEVENLISVDSVEGMLLRANLALQLKHLPDGSKVVYEVDTNPADPRTP